MMKNPWIAAIVGAVSVTVGVALSQAVGWMDGSPSDYAVGAVAGAVGGFIGALISRRRTS